MKRFRLPRKVMKSLKGNLWLYPADEKGNSLMAHPNSSQEDYIAMKRPKAIIAYYNFVNAYHLFEKGDDSFGNICCLAVDRAKELLRAQKRNKKHTGKRHK